MAEFIGSRISLISKSDIRYVGTLHEINSENSTVALEQVVSFGTEGRRPKEEVAASDFVYAYIVFRGSDVKDLRIEENPKKETLPQQPVPDDPAILGSTRRNSPPSAPPSTVQKPVQAQVSQPQQSQFPQQAQSSQPQQSQTIQQPSQNQQRQQPLPRYPQPPFPYYYPPPPQQRFGPQGFPANSGFPGMPYGAPPPNWYPPPGQGYHYPLPGQFYPQPPIGSAAQQHVSPGLQGPHPQQVAASTATDMSEQKPKLQQEGTDKPVATVKLPSASTTPAPAPAAQNDPPPPPNESKPDVAAALAPPAIETPKDETSIAKPTPTMKLPPGSMPTGPKSGRIMPAIPRLSPAMKPPVPVNGTLQSKPKNAVNENDKVGARPAYNDPTQIAKKSVEDANRDARAAVEAAMAKLPLPPGQKKQSDKEGVMDNLTNKVSAMRTNDNIRTSKQPGTGGYAAGYRGGRGGHRGGRFQGEDQKNKVDVPATDYDFASANAKFNKQDLVKEAIATGSAIGSPVEGSNATENPIELLVNGARNGSQSNVVSSIASYNKTSSFFDNISSESKDRDDGNAKKLGGREFRSEEQKKNLETFGQGSVDNGYRGGPGYRGRRGRGYGRSRGGYARGGRGGMRGGSGTVTAES